MTTENIFVENAQAGDQSDYFIIRIFIILTTFLGSLPLYILLVMIFWSATRSTYNGESGFVQGEENREPPVFRLSQSVDFSYPPPIKRAETREEFLDSLVMAVKADKSAMPRNFLYLRNRSFEKFSAKGVDSDLGFTDDTGGNNFSVGEDRSGDAGRPEMQYEMAFAKNFEGVLPHVPSLKSIKTDREYSLAGDGSVRFPTSIAGGETISCVSIPEKFLDEKSEIQAVPADSPYLDTAALNGPGLTELAAQAAGGAQDQVEKARAIQKFVAENYKYSLQPSPTLQNSKTPLRDYLLKERQGHCQYSAAGTVALLRMNGIPSRVAGGFRADVTDKEGRTFFVNETSAHAWPEVLTKKGWEILDVPVKSLAEEKAKAIPLVRPEWEDMKKRMASIMQKTVKEGGKSPNRRVRNPDWEKNREKIKQRNPKAVKEKEKIDEGPGFWGKIYFKYLLPLAKFLMVAVFGVVFLLFWRLFFMKVVMPFLTWLLKNFRRLRRKKPVKKEAAPGNFSEELSENLRKSDLRLDPKDIVASFNRLSLMLGETANMERLEHETPGEYLSRLCQLLDIDMARFQVIPDVFSAAYYGKKKQDGESAREYLQAMMEIIRHPKFRPENLTPGEKP